MSWECSCGVSNKDSVRECRACGFPIDMAAEALQTPNAGDASHRIFGSRSTSIQYKSAERDLVRFLGKVLIGGGALIGFGAGVHLGRTRFLEGPGSSNALLSYAFSLPWNLSSGLNAYVLIGLGIALILSLYLLPEQARQNIFSLLGLLFIGLITCSVIATLTYSLTIFILQLKPYFGA